MNTKVASYLIYPAIVALSISFYAVTSSNGGDLAVCAFSSVILGAILIAVVELLFPYQLKWKPEIQDIKNDLIFMMVVQIAIPRFLGFVVVIILGIAIGGNALFSDIWPHDWPVVWQAILLIVSADFMRYWLHRLSHTTPMLWRLHAVHHSTDRLYWLNTSRFHPIEKTLHFTLDSLPFILIGVDPHVIGFWFVLYSVNGFFQHSNIRLKFGILSMIFSTAEMHRWHHSKIPEESNANYANVFIVWDRMFGTFYRPAREVGTLGLLYPEYPMGFIQQMKAPFIGELYSQNASLKQVKDD